MQHKDMNLKEKSVFLERLDYASISSANESAEYDGVSRVSTSKWMNVPCYPSDTATKKFSLPFYNPRWSRSSSATPNIL